MTPIDDDELRGMLEERGSRHAIDVHSVLDGARRDAIATGRVRRPRFVMGLRPVLAGLGSVLAIALVVILVVVPLSMRPSASAGPNAGSSPSVGSSASDAVPSPSLDVGPAQVEALTADGLATWLTRAGTSAKGRVVLFQGELIADPSVDCAANRSDCPPTVVRGAPQPIVVEPVGDIGPGPWDGSGPLTGTFALRGTDRTWAGTAPVMEFLATVRSQSLRACGKNPDCHGPLAWSVPDLFALAPADGSDWFLVTGWLVRTPLHSCPSPASVYGCPSSDVLTRDRVQPTSTNGSFDVPFDGLSLPAGTYEAFAPDPALEGIGVVPRVGTFLVQRIVVAPCGPLEDCYVGPEHRHWIMRARVDPIEAATALTPTPAPSTAPAGDRYPGGIPRVIGDEPVLVGLDAQARWRDATDATPFLVGGWFDSHTFNTCSGGIGPGDPNPLASRTCPRYDVAGVPGRPVYPDSVAMPEGDGPIVLRVHTRDPGAETCIPETIDQCRQRVLVDASVWFGDATTAAAPIGPREAISRSTGVFVMEWRPEGANSQMAVNDDVFTLPLACPAPWPSLVFSIHGDPRYGLVAVFPDPASRERFQASMAPGDGSCAANEIDRPAAPRWVGHENILVVTFGDDTFADRLAAVLQGPQPNQAALPMVEPEFDRSLETVTDYLAARASGALDHAWAERLVDLTPEDPLADPYKAWMADVFKRHAANALVVKPDDSGGCCGTLGQILRIVGEPTEANVGAAAMRVLRDPGVTRSAIFPGHVPGRNRSEAGDRGVSRHPDTGVVVPRLAAHPDQGRALSGDVVSSTNRSSQERGDAADRGARPVRQRPFPGGTISG